MLMSAKECYLEVDGLKTFYFRAGSGYPLLLIHGGSPGACAKVSWKKNVDFLAKAGFEVYAFDQPGYGNTESPSDYSLEYRVRHAKFLIDQIGLKRFHLIGNSQGGYIAARIALEDKRAAGLVLVSSGTLAPAGSDEAIAMAERHRQETQAYMPSFANAEAFSSGTVFNQDLAKEMAEERYLMSAGQNYTTQMARRSAPPPKPLHDELQTLTVKTLVLWGKNDRGAAVERGLLLFKLIPNAELHVFDRCAHWVQWDQSDRFNEIVANFLHNLS
jgi:pimeloyl-ACP methyl ester carboxylesterase